MAIVFDPGSDRAAIPAATLEERVRQHRGALRACARRLLGSDEEADAVVEEVLAAAPRALALFRPSGSLGSWLQGVTVGAALARLRAASTSEPGDEESWPLADPGSDGLAADPLHRDHLAALAAALPAPVRAVYVLRDLEALDLEEAAALLGIAAATARARLHRARSALATLLAEIDAA